MRKDNFLVRLVADESGATAIEYGLIVALIVIAIIGAMDAFATTTSGMWARVSSEVQRATSNI